MRCLQPTSCILLPCRGENIFFLIATLTVMVKWKEARGIRFAQTSSWDKAERDDNFNNEAQGDDKDASK